ncbi:hypothetical protein QRO08_16800 [Paracidovorax citrulli]|uniref:Uncharacterized protein n=2 Tax=Paracidovorax citrulli TaxID=80869 RepID=A1TMJ7_PARC0|nr:hypothetical protein [Paracidovorax citrulli]ABM32185.1 conserved hypothetical protein [Paracidovorax citrulli AAC00-1]ATG94801.1 hypothetical protein CQB05_12790 [Paracidovorax citrulli]PVY66375.1 hypothetical protein C8E08_3782 [Paracidovorax citrulli]REG69454.1 hypothetical protein C8E07_2605 [Paracidovorax citrulli]RLJ94008.1 hypothetical protein C8E06_2604 [Paracidovorax citrulli]
MIGNQRTGGLPNVVIHATSHEGLLVDIDGKRARLAVVDEDGNVVAAGPDVAREAEAVVLNNYRNTLKGQGFLRTYSGPIQP